MKRKQIWPFFILTCLICAFSINYASAKDSATVSKMKNRLSKEIDQNDKASDKVKGFAKEVLVSSINHPAFVSAVSDQNAKGVSLDSIKAIDNKWKNAEDLLPIHDEMMESPCADAIRKMVKDNSAIFEAFVMDNQGANVCQNELTSDYWQGDEAKWKNSFKGGKGGVDIGVEKLDKSTNEVLQQVSLPIIRPDGQVIGAVTFGIKTGRL